jgi:hypothetical protein
MNLEHLTLANLIWLRDVAFKAKELRINEENMNTLLRAKALIKNTEVEKLSCWSCSARSYFTICKSILDQYQQAIIDKITELETVELSQTLYYVDNSIEDEEVIANSTQEYNENNEVSDDVIEEKIVSMESSENEITVTTVKRAGRPKKQDNEE